MSGQFVRRVGIVAKRKPENLLNFEGLDEPQRPTVRAFVSDVDEDARPSFTPLRELAARYFDQETAHRVAELVRRLDVCGPGEEVRVFRGRFAR
jgi:hypothetical protein